jgi:hypothetical protein
MRNRDRLNAEPRILSADAEVSPTRMVDAMLFRVTAVDMAIGFMLRTNGYCPLPPLSHWPRWARFGDWFAISASLCSPTRLRGVMRVGAVA